MTPNSTPVARHSHAPSALADVGAALAARGTTALLIAQGEAVLHEQYGDGWSAERPHYTASLAKALVGGLSLMVALGDGLIGADDLAAQYVPSWADDSQKRQITIRHLATHTSGLDDAEASGLPHDQLSGWKGQFWRREPDPFTLARDLAPVVFPPGTAALYSNPGVAMLAYCVTAALQRASHSSGVRTDLRTRLRERVYEPVGLAEGEWSIGYGTTYEVDGLPLVANWGGGSFTARAIARLGRLLLQGGTWEGRVVLDPQAVRLALHHDPRTPVPDRPGGEPNPASGLCWYTNEDGVWPAVPRDAFVGAGAGHQLLVVVPSLDLVIVRQGEHLLRAREASFWGAAYIQLIAPVVVAVERQFS